MAGKTAVNHFLCFYFFEDDFTRQYREIIQRIPVKALLNEKLSDDDFQMALNKFTTTYI